MAGDTQRREAPEIVAALVHVVVELERAGRGDLVSVLFNGLTAYLGAERAAALWDAVSCRAADLIPGIEQEGDTND